MHELPDEPAELATAPLLSRRTFVAAAAAAVVGATTATLISEPSGGAACLETAAPAANPTPVVGFHMDRPYLDLTGTAEPYHPPAGLRSGQALAALSETQWLSRHPYLL
jgi:hypothetical protein